MDWNWRLWLGVGTPHSVVWAPNCTTNGISSMGHPQLGTTNMGSWIFFIQFFSTVTCTSWLASFHFSIEVLTCQVIRSIRHWTVVFFLFFFFITLLLINIFVEWLRHSFFFIPLTQCFCSKKWKSLRFLFIYLFLKIINVALCLAYYCWFKVISNLQFEKKEQKKRNKKKLLPNCQ